MQAFHFAPTLALLGTVSAGGGDFHLGLGFGQLLPLQLVRARPRQEVPPSLALAVLVRARVEQVEDDVLDLLVRKLVRGSVLAQLQPELVVEAGVTRTPIPLRLDAFAVAAPTFGGVVGLASLANLRACSLQCSHETQPLFDARQRLYLT